ncbi:DUF72 domain-containing protein [Desulfurococcus sp.]|jgi:uncharacterized protein YecE (DUF72 family)|uniref:DUF72 domain-containing protein n=2 Tax=Desulfurococcus sp. TaxID=51678 RepID=UPI00315F2265
MVPSVIRIGCCGFPVSRKRYVKEFNVVELQNTFYNLPSIEWCRMLHESLPQGFEITIKAWQAVTHPPTSPTWRRMRSKPRGELSNYGYLKYTRENIDALTEIVERARILGAGVIVFQTPSSMPCDKESLENVDRFFKEAVNIAGRDVKLGWEPRGECGRRREVLELIRENELIHVVDPFKAMPVSLPGGVAYFRLHGIGGEVNYRYRYSDGDLMELYKLITKLNPRVTYVMFNNVYMFEDALRFKKLVESMKT